MNNSAIITYYLKSPASSDPTLEITSPAGLKRVVTLPRAAGVHRYRWDLSFTVTTLNDEQRAAIVRRFEGLIRAGGEEVASVQQAYDRYRAATTDAARREAAQILVEMGGQLAAELRGPVGGPGTYRLLLTVDGRSYPGSLAVRADPLLNK